MDHLGSMDSAASMSPIVSIGSISSPDSMGFYGSFGYRLMNIAWTLTLFWQIFIVLITMPFNYVRYNAATISLRKINSWSINSMQNFIEIEQFWRSNFPVQKFQSSWLLSQSVKCTVEENVVLIRSENLFFLVVRHAYFSPFEDAWPNLSHPWKAVKLNLIFRNLFRFRCP